MNVARKRTALAAPVARGTLVTWGYYSVTGVLRGSEGPAPGSDAAQMAEAALAARGDTTQVAFWAAWWNEDPRQNQDALPDDMGIVVGPSAHEDAVGDADRAIRRGKNWTVYTRSIGADYARRAYRAGARRQDSGASVSRQAGRRALEELGLDEQAATPAAVRRAFKRILVAKKLHPDQGGDPEAFQALVETRKRAIAHLKLLEGDARASAYSRGESVPQRRPRSRKKAKQAATEARTDG